MKKVPAVIGIIRVVEEDTYTTSEAARILKVSDSYVRRLVRLGELEAHRDEHGRHLIPQRAIHALLEERRESVPRDQAPPPTGPAEADQELRELHRRLEDLQRQLGRLEGRLELTERTESTMQGERERLIAHLEEERAERRRLQQRVEELSVPWYRRWFRR